MKRHSYFFSLIFLVLAAPDSQAQAVRSTNTVYKFFATLTSTVDTIQVTNTANAALYVKSFAGSADGVAIHANVKYVSGTITGFKGYVYPSNDGVNYGYTPIDSFLVKVNSGTQAYVIQGAGNKFNAPFYKLLFQGAGTGVARITYASIIGKK